MLDIVTIGESMVQLTPPRSGRLRHAARFERFVSGAASNVAIGLSRLGHASGWVSRVGTDEFGACVIAAIRGEGVDVSQVRRDSEAQTGIFFKERRRPNDTRAHYYRQDSAGSRFAPGDLDLGYLSDAAYVHLTGIFPALSVTCREAVWTVLRAAGDQGFRVSFDPNIRRRLWSEKEAREVLLDMIPHVHILLAGIDEARLLSGKADPESAACSLQTKGPEHVVVRLEEEGALAVDPAGEVQRSPALPVDVVEPVGAGDAFNAGFLSGRLRGWEVGPSLRLGNILGGLATTTLGDVEGLPTWEEAQAHLENSTSVGR